MNLEVRPGRADDPAGSAEADQVRSQQPEPAGADEDRAFTSGSIGYHVLVMTATGSVGFIAIFFVDLLTLLYVSRLGDTRLTAAVGYASQMTLLLESIDVGLSIAVSATVSHAIGAGDHGRARRLATSGLVLSAGFSAALALGAMPFTREILALFGATGETLEVAAVFLRIALPAMAFLGVGMACAAILRGIGDARHAMYVGLSGALVTACLDPILIFVLHLGVVGAAIVLVISRFCLMLVGLHGAGVVHGFVERPSLAALRQDLRPIAHVAGPAVLTNLASPLSNIYVIHVFSRFGEAVVAAYSIMDRVTPVAFGMLFALSGSVGPIMGQNYGARLFGRVRQTLTCSYLLAGGYVAVVTAMLWVGAPLLVALFDAHGVTADLLRFFCHYGGFMWLFVGALFVANAAFNNLDWPTMSTAFNWGRATLGTVPFTMAGAMFAGPRGGYLGLAAGYVLFGCFAVGAAYVVVGRIASRPAPIESS